MLSAFMLCLYSLHTVSSQMVEVEKIEIENEDEWRYISTEFERAPGRSFEVVVSSLLIQLNAITTRVIGESLIL